MLRYKIIVAYDGTNFKGWQIQNNSKTIQGELEDALKIINNNKSIKIFGSGRTDSGVHAIAQVAHFDFDFKERSKFDLKNAINGNLPDEIRIIDCEKVPSNFHARFSAVSRTYKYKTRTNGNIFDKNYTWRVGKLNLSLLNELASMIIGTHDFTSFSKISSNLNSRKCNIYESSWYKKDNLLVYKITGNRFLHHMVRYLVGTMVEVSKGNYKKENFINLINNPQKKKLVFKAPPSGLFLENVNYEII